jgi:hypothetical protein
MNSIPGFVIQRCIKKYILVKQQLQQNWIPRSIKLLWSQHLYIWSVALWLCPYQVELAYAGIELDTDGLDCSTQHIQIYLCVPPGVRCAAQNHFFRLTYTACKA